MVDFFATFNQTISTLSFTEFQQAIYPLIIIMVGITIYSLLVFKFYRFVARRDILTLNLAKYNREKYAAEKKTLRTLLYILEFFIIFPVLIFIWFAGMSIVLIFISPGTALSDILLFSIGVVSAIRICAYYNGNLAQDLAKLLPFALLAIIIIDFSTLSLETTRDILYKIPEHWETLLYYLSFTIILEIILRLVHTIIPKDRKIPIPERYRKDQDYQEETKE